MGLTFRMACRNVAIPIIGQFRHFKIHLEIIDFSTSLRGIKYSGHFNINDLRSFATLLKQ